MKKKNEFFMAVYRARWNGRRWGSDVWRIAFGNKSRLPLDAGRAYMTDDSGNLNVIVHLDPPLPKFVQGHRVKIECRKCHRMIPAGRIHQHTC